MRRCLVALMALLASVSSLFAQNKVPAPHRAIPARVNKKIDWSKRATPRSMVGGLWMTDANFKSSIYLRSVVETDPVTVTPILWLSNGMKYTLPDVTIEPAGVAIIDINAGLQSKGVSSWATLTGYVELQYTWPWDPLCATIRDVDVAHSLIFTYGLHSTTPLNGLAPKSVTVKSESHTVEGMWWKEIKEVTGFVALANVSSQPVQATVQVSDQLANSLIQHTVTVSPHGTKRVNLSELPQLTGSEGGIRIAYTGPSDALIINGGLEDESVGYSAVLPFSSRPVHVSDLPPYAMLSEFTSLAELGLMVGAADPMMNFPAGTTFKPYSMLRNVSATALSVTPTIWWMQGGTAHSARLQQLRLEPYQSQNVDLMSMLALAGLGTFNGSFNVVFEGDLKRGSLIAAAGSVDQTKTYVFEVQPRGVAESTSKSLQYWSTGNGDDTMITLWNPADEAQDLVFKLIFSGGHYLVPIHLGARATRTINVSEITQNAVADAEGNTIPPSIHEGSAKITGSHADNENILIAIDSGTYNIRKATCGQTCYTCDGYTDWAAEASPFAVGVNKQYTLSLSAAYDNGSRYNFSATWSSGNTSIATVVSSTGTTTGVSHGSVNIGGPVADLQSAPVYVSDVCTQGYDPCPVGFGGGGSSTGSVLSVTGVSPPNLVLGTGVPPTIAGTMTISGSGFSTLLYPTAAFDASTGITTGTVSVVSDTTMTVPYSVDCSALVGTYDLTVGDSVDGGLFGTTWPEGVVLPSGSPATLTLGGKSISGTQSVVVGQQIALATITGLPPCMSLASEQWTPTLSTSAGAPVGGFSAASGSSSVTALPTNTNSSYTFYWVYPTNGVTATYQYTMSGGGSSAAGPVSTATFNVTGAGTMTNNPYTKVTIDSLQPCGGGTAGPAMVYGNITGTICKANAGGTWGIYFVPSGAPAGTYSYVQLINTDTTTYTPNSGSLYTCTTSQGVDSAYPYAGIIPNTNPPQALDAPGVPLPSVNYKTVNRSFSATMFLLFTSSVANSIPVPLGYQTWAFNGTAKCTSSCGTVANWTPTTNGTPGPVGSFAASNGTQTTDGYTALKYGYPIWGNVATQSCH